jgi:cytochrome b561
VSEASFREEHYAMGLKGTADRYGTMILAIHWVSALLIIFLLVSGFRAANTDDAAAKAAILRFHIPLALAVLALTVWRIGASGSASLGGWR